jgi:hypothetical protein
MVEVIIEVHMTQYKWGHCERSQVSSFSLTYAMILFVKLNFANKNFICFARVALEI